MSDTETRALGRTALLLLAASALRLAWGSPPPAPPSPDAPPVIPELLAESRARAEEERARSRPLDPGERLDPNRASAVELDRLPGVGPATADAVVRSRESDGPYAGPEDLLRVRGVGPVLVSKISDHLIFEGVLSIRGEPGRRGGGTPEGPRDRRAPSGSPVPVDVNRADTTALQALPGVGPALARRIVEARQGSPFRSVDDLERVKGIGPATLERLRPLVTVRD